MNHTTVKDEAEVLRVFQTKDEVRAFYDKIAGVYDLLAEHSERPVRQAGLELLAPEPGESILEVGCGTGHCLRWLANAVGSQGRVFGVDISEGMLEEAQKLVSHQNVELHRCDAAQIPFADASFDGIFTSFTLELFDTPELPDVLREWRRVLKPDGRVVVVSISKEGHPNLISKAFEWTHRHFPNLMDCRPIYVRRALEAAKFFIEGSRLEMMWVPVEIVRAVK